MSTRQYKLETSHHLFQPPVYKTSGGSLCRDFGEALDCSGSKLTWDVSAVLGILSFGYPTGDRTLINGIKRQPWLSAIDDNGEFRLEELPAHGFRWANPAEIAGNLEILLLNEAERVCNGYEEIYILLSGGLDSRIVAGIVSRLYNEGKIQTRPVGVTWGLEKSRDVVYGRAVADALGLEWRHFPLSAINLLENIPYCCEHLGCFPGPNHLHSMLCCKQFSKDALVLAGSFGDSIGRAEYSKKHVIELDYIEPINQLGLIQDDLVGQGLAGIVSDQQELIDRAVDAPKHAQCEHQMQGFYMRSLIGHVMSSINSYCRLYQMFTAPEVYSYIWSLHPICRNDRVYAVLLEHLNPKIARLPWARSNKALRGRTVGAIKGLSDYHKYADWISGPVMEEYESCAKPALFADNGIFYPDRVDDLTKKVKTRSYALVKYGFRAYEIWLSLAAFRKFAELLESRSKAIDVVRIKSSAKTSIESVKSQPRSSLRMFLRQSKVLCKIFTMMRKVQRRRYFLKKYPLGRC